jgi:hypothetical protein
MGAAPSAPTAVTPPPDAPLFFHHGWGTYMTNPGVMRELNAIGQTGLTISPQGTTLDPDFGIPILSRSNVQWRNRNTEIFKNMPAAWIAPRILEVKPNYDLRNYSITNNPWMGDVNHVASQRNIQAPNLNVAGEVQLAPGYFNWMTRRAQSILHPITRRNFLNEMQNLDREWTASFQRQEQEANDLVDLQINVFNKEMELEQMQLDELIRIIDREYL